MKKLLRMILCAMMVGLFACAVCFSESLEGTGDRTGAPAIKVDGSYIFFEGDLQKEWFSFKADNDPAYYRFDAKNEEVDTSVYMELFDVNGLSLKKVELYEGKSGYISWKADPDGVYYVCFTRYNEKKSGRVTLSVSKSPDIYGNTLEEAHEVTLKDNILTTFDGTGDTDVFVFTTEAGSAFYKASFKNENVDTSVYMELFDALGLSLGKKEATKGREASVSWKVEPESEYYLKFYRYDDKKGGKYMFSLSRTPDNEGDTFEEANAAMIDQMVQASFDGKGDIDVFKLTTEAGEAFYRIDFKNETVDTSVYMELFDSFGLSLGRKEASKGRTGYKSWKVEPESDYYLKFYRYDENKNGKYTFSYIRTPDGEGDGYDSANDLAFGQPVQASFDGTGDTDMFVFATGEESAFVKAEYKNETVDTTVYMEIHDENQLMIHKAEASKGREKFISFKAEPEKTYYIFMYRYDDDKNGRYTMNLSSAVDKEADNIDSALTILNNVPVSASFDGTGDQDFFAIETRTGDYFYELTYRNEDTDTYVYCEIQDADGMKIYSAEAGKGKEKTIGWHADDAECVFVRFYRNDDKKSGEYTFTLTEKEDIGANTPERAYVVEPGEEAIITRDAENDIDYVSFAESDACIRIINRHEKYAYIALVDAYDQKIGDEIKIRRGEGASFENVSDAYAIRIRTEGDQVYAYSCAGETHAPGGEWIEAVPASCEMTGLKEMMCVVCLDVCAEEVIDTLAHTPGDWETIREADCEADGYEARLCTVCGFETERRTIMAPGHAYGKWMIEIEAGCEADGLQKQFCTLCNKLIRIEKIPAFGHILGNWVTEKGDCETDTIKTRACQVCGEIIETEKTAATGHEKGKLETISQATCEQDGYIVVKCTHCGKTLEETKPGATGHAFGDWTVVKEATYSEEGLEERKCANCGATEQKTIEKKSIKGGLFGNNQ